MKPEILLKAYLEYQSEDAFRDLVVGTLDEVYASSLRMGRGAPYLAEEIALCVYLELAREAPRLGESVVLTSWLRERTCQAAMRILRAQEDGIDWAAWKREKRLLPVMDGVRPAPPGIAVRICRSIFLGTARYQSRRLFSPPTWWPTWVRPLPVGGLIVCASLVILVWSSLHVHRRDPVVLSQGATLTPSSFAQLASPADGGPPLAIPLETATTAINTNQ